MDQDTTIDYTLGTEWLANLPEKPCKERDQAILDAVSSNLIQVNWVPITSEILNHTAVFYVCEDALYINASWTTLDNHLIQDNSNIFSGRFRPQASAHLTQLVADLLQASLPTTKIWDQSYLQSQIILDAVLLPASPQMDTTSSSKLYNQKLETFRANQVGLLRDSGKIWALDNKLGTGSFGIHQAVNYGYYDKKAPITNVAGIKLWQGNAGSGYGSAAHNDLHTDHSQCLNLMLNQCEIDGQVANVADIMKDPELCHLLSYEGPIKFTRQPGV